MSGRGFIKSQNEQLDELKAICGRCAASLVEADQSDAPTQIQRERLFDLSRAYNKYFSALELEVTNSGKLTGQDFKAWKQDWIVTATKNLYELPRYFEVLRETRDRLGLPQTTFEPAVGSFRNIQAFFAANCSGEVASLKAILTAANLPTGGLDKPFMPRPHRSWTWARPFIWVAVALLVLAGFGVVATYVNIWLVPVLIGAVVTILVIISAIELVREGAIKEKSYLEIAKLALRKRFQFNMGSGEKSASSESTVSPDGERKE